MTAKSWILAAVIGFLAVACHRGLPKTAEKKPTICSDVADCISQARQFAASNDIEAAIRTLDIAIEKEPANQEARQLRGDLYYKKNDLDKAMADYAELRSEKGEQMAARSKTPPVLRDSEATEQMRQARMEEDSGQIETALRRYNAVLTWEISSTTASLGCQNRGNLYSRKGEIEIALIDYQQAIRLNPRNAGAYTNRGFALSQQGDQEAAIRDFDEALHFEPNLYQAFYNRGLAYRALGDLEKAESDLDRTIALNPDFALAHVNRAALYAQKKRFAEAAAGYKAAMKVDSTMPEPFIGLAFLSLHDGKQAEAADYLDKALKLNPKSPQILNSLGWLRATSPTRSLRDARKAVDLAMQACQLTYWWEFQYVDTLAAAYAEQGNFAKAVEFQRFAMSLPSLNETERDGAEKRLKLYSNHQPYRDTTQP